MKKRKTVCSCVEWYVASTNQIVAFEYVPCTNQIAASGYVSRTNHITAFGYLAPITAFRGIYLAPIIL